MKDILDVINNIQTIYSTNSSLSVLKDFERVLDQMNMYVYKNWEDGELVSGPTVERHWVSASFMWPKNKMPDPSAATRLLDHGCKVTFERTHLLKPRKIKSQEDFRIGTKKGKLDREPVWVVEITIPKKLISGIYNGYMTKMKDEMGIGRTGRVDAAPAQAAETQSVAMGGDGGMGAGGMPGGANA